MSNRQLEILWHTIGMKRCNYRRKLSWWLSNKNHRNCFAMDWNFLNSDNQTRLEIQSLLDTGLLERGRDFPGGMACFYVTNEGITLAKKEFK